jgi:hypothetical protein
VDFTFSNRTVSYLLVLYTYFNVLVRDHNGLCCLYLRDVTFSPVCWCGDERRGYAVLSAWVGLLDTTRTPAWLFHLRLAAGGYRWTGRDGFGSRLCGVLYNIAY